MAKLGQVDSSWTVLPTCRAGVHEGLRDCSRYRGCEALAEPDLTRATAPRYLGEVHASGGCEKEFHGLDDERLERFA